MRSISTLYIQKKLRVVCYYKIGLKKFLNDPSKYLFSQNKKKKKEYIQTQITVWLKLFATTVLVAEFFSVSTFSYE